MDPEIQFPDFYAVQSVAEAHQHSLTDNEFHTPSWHFSLALFN